MAERESLDASERATVVWPLTRDILTGDDYEQLAGLVTVRSWTWRVRIAAGTVAADDPDGPIEHAVVYEAVIDLADPRPRLGYLREITMLQTASTLAAALELEAEVAAAIEPDPVESELADLDDLMSTSDLLEDMLGPAGDGMLEIEPPIEETPWPADEPAESPGPPVAAPDTGTPRVGRWIP